MATAQKSATEKTIIFARFPCNISHGVTAQEKSKETRQIFIKLNDRVP